MPKIKKRIELVQKRIELVQKRIELVQKYIELVQKCIELVQKCIELVQKCIELVQKCIELTKKPRAFLPVLFVGLCFAVFVFSGDYAGIKFEAIASISCNSSIEFSGSKYVN